MAFADPQEVQYDGLPVDLNLITREPAKAIYSKEDETLSLTISHQRPKGRTKSMVRLDEKGVVANPLNASDQDFETNSVYIVWDRPDFGFDLDSIQDLTAALVAWCTPTNVQKVFGRQS